LQLISGQTTESFKRYPNSSYVRLSFSLIYWSKEERTLDLTANDDQTFELWFCGLQVDYNTPPLPPLPSTLDLIANENRSDQQAVVLQLAGSFMPPPFPLLPPSTSLFASYFPAAESDIPPPPPSLPWVLGPDHQQQTDPRAMVLQLAGQS